jgi:uncharacterized protein
LAWEGCAPRRYCWVLKGVLSQASGSAGYGELVPDPGRLIDLLQDFRYRVVSEEGTALSSRGTVPGDRDGMVAFSGPSSNTTVLVRNHEKRVGSTCRTAA